MPIGPMADKMNQQQKEYLELAGSHFSKDLAESDRQALKKASQKLGTHVSVGAGLGAALGLYIAIGGRMRMHRAFQQLKAAPKPKEVIMQSGEHVQIPKKALEMELREPGPVLTGLSGLLFTTLGFLVGANTGLLTGAYSARSVVQKEANVPRLQEAYRAFRIDLLKKQIAELEQAKPDAAVWGVAKDLW